MTQRVSKVAPIAGLEAMHAEAPAMVWAGGACSAAQLRTEIASMAARCHSLGTPGSPLAIVSASRRRLLVGVLAALSAGRPALPLDPARPDLDACLHACEPGGALADQAIGLPSRLPRSDLNAASRGGSPAARGPGACSSPIDGDEPALLVPTSGTSGNARVAMLSAAALDAHVAASRQALPPFAAGDCWLVCLPFTSIGALAAVWRIYSAGGCLALLDGSFDAAAARALMANGVSHISLVPAMLDALVEVDAPPPRGLRCVLSGGGPLSAAQAELARALGWPLWQGWGMTETASHVAVGPVDPEWTPGVVGHPLPGVTIDSVADPVTGDGRLRIAGPMLMGGYAQPGLAPGVGLDEAGRLLTGDAGEWLPDGRLQILGRADGVIVTGGVNVHPEAVEARFAECPEAGEVALTARPDPRWGSVLVALYTGSADADTLADWARKALPGAWRPREFRRVATLPRNAMGKLLRAQLAELLR